MIYTLTTDMAEIKYRLLKSELDFYLILEADIPVPLKEKWNWIKKQYNKKSKHRRTSDD